LGQLKRLRALLIRWKHGIIQAGAVDVRGQPDERGAVEATVGYSELYERALRMAAQAHRRQNRKGSDVPYITHPVHVSVILLRYGFPTEVAIAALLHDVVEDQGVGLTEIKEAFGGGVAEVVAALSELKTDAQGNERPWEVRKQEAVVCMRQASLEAVAVKAADALHNLRSIALDLREGGAKTWQRFSRGPEATLGFYQEVVQVAQERLPDHSLVSGLAEALDDLARALDIFMN
jgi:(p)ppGpp synthase/HD superfamily hydrolase